MNRCANQTAQVVIHNSQFRIARKGARLLGGFTLVEVLAAVVLLSVGLLAVLAASRASREAQRRASYIAAGRAVAQSRIDYLRSISVDGLGAKAGTTTSTSLPSGNSVVTGVAHYPTSSENNLYRVTVTVNWPEGNGTRTVRYDTLMVRK